MAEAFPLHWPDGWPRTPSYKRTRSRFQVTPDGATRKLMDELRLLGARNVVLSTNVALRRDGLPYARQQLANEDPGAAVYFTLDGDPRVMARDVYERLHENIHSIAHAVEHMRGLARHGGDFMMKRAFSGFVALAAPGTTPWWQILGIAATASAAEINAAYRKLAAERHPDRGGSEAMMADLNVARDAGLKGASS